ncbi:hypothetical protein TEA_022157 [Camellia sinensis var. sinensis]|uniref:Uncharacterized protein n=1 Tax=Camellia sinensis var. sinensis TaxID=542762 RepID=A0A4S4EFS8_CAMSN|nr:hypothetical protein TEA_022157 [Camellia sinensis var. sinensis]
MANPTDEFRFVSPTIHHLGRVPRKYTGAKKDLWPIMPWAHWVVVNIPPTLRGLPEGFSGKEEEVGGDYGGIKEGHNDWKVSGYRGPKMPTFGHHPPGHRLEFTLYALDEDLHHGNKVAKEKLLDAIEGHVLGEAVLLAYF